MDEIRKNITDTIRKMKKSGTTGASIGCLFQCTPTTGVTVEVSEYRSMFESAAKTIADRMRFQLY
jgi:hypothetical protein